MKYTRAEFDHRHKLTGLRIEAMKQTITLSLATIAIPTAVAGLRMLPRHDTAPVPWAVYWLLSLLGILSAILSLLCGIIYLWRAPKWARDARSFSPFAAPPANSNEAAGTIAEKFSERLLDITYPAAAIGMVIAAIFFMIAAFVAFFVSPPS
jgi:hypothetical protein